MHQLVRITCELTFLHCYLSKACIAVYGIPPNAGKVTILMCTANGHMPRDLSIERQKGYTSAFKLVSNMHILKAICR